MTELFKVTEESLGPSAMRAFRSMASIEYHMPRNASMPSIAARIEIPWHLVVRRKVQDILTLRPSKREAEKERTR